MMTSTAARRLIHRAMLEPLLPSDAVFAGDTTRSVPCGSLLFTPQSA